MSTTPRPDEELERLLAALTDGESADRDQQELAALLRDNPQLHEVYVDYICLDTILSWEHPGETDASSPPAPSMQTKLDEAKPMLTPMSRVGRRIAAFRTAGYVTIAATAVAAVVTVAVAMIFWMRIGDIQVPGKVSTSAQMADLPSSEAKTSDHFIAPFARLIAADSARFERGQPQYDRSVDAGEYVLVEGAISLRLKNGVELTLEAPAEFELIHQKLVSLRRGKARARVPESAVGFVMSAPGVDLKDLGTEFGVLVESDQTTALQVFTGAVEIHQAGQSPVQVDEDSTTILKDGRALTPDSFSDIDFPTPAQIAYQQWRTFSEKLRADPSAVTYYDFERDPRDPHVLKDRSAGLSPVDGHVRGCFWVSGRWPKKGALFFENDGDCVEVDIPGHFDAFTLHAWIRINRLEFPRQTFFGPRGWDRPGLHKVEFGNAGELRFVVRGDSPESHLHRAPVGTIQVGAWVHLAAVVDRINQVATYYKDGQEILSAPVAPDFPLVFGPSIIGGFAQSHSKSWPYNQQFRGWIDELALFDRALSAAEVNELYELRWTPKNGTRVKL